MEFVEGVKINNLEKIDAAGLDRSELAQVLVRSLIKQLLIDGFFHGDPHPGNILVNLQTGVIQYLDMGMMGTLDSTQRMNFADLIYTLYAGDINELGHALINFSTQFKPFDKRAFLNELDRVVGRFFMFPSEQDQFANSMSATLDVMYKHGLRLDTALTLAIKAMIQVEEAAFVLDPQMSLVEVAVDEGKLQFAQQISYDSVKEAVRREATRTVKELVRKIPTLQEATLKWIEQYESGRLNLYVDTSDLANQVKDFGIGIRYLTLGLIVLGMLLATALVAGQDIPGLEGFATLGLLIFIGSMIARAIPDLPDLAPLKSRLNSGHRQYAALSGDSTLGRGGGRDSPAGEHAAADSRGPASDLCRGDSGRDTAHRAVGARAGEPDL